VQAIDHVVPFYDYYYLVGKFLTYDNGAAQHQPKITIYCNINMIRSSGDCESSGEISQRPANPKTNSAAIFGPPLINYLRKWKTTMRDKKGMSRSSIEQPI